MDGTRLPLPVTYSRTARARLAVARAVGASAGAASRISGRGQGIVVTGHLIQSIAPDALAQLSAGRSTVLVSGTNGKSTTTAMIAAALGGAVATNTTGANMSGGVIEAYSRSSARVAAMEVDELYVPAIGSATKPEIFVALNLSRDQMDRMHEVGAVARRWSGYLDGSEVHVIANATDPNIVAAVGTRSATWVDPGWVWRQDSVVCPRCTAVLTWEAATWSCTCGLRQPVADYTVDGDVVHLPAGASVRLDLSLPGAVNRGNAAFAIAVAERMGVGVDDAVRRISTIDEVEGRYGSIQVGERSARTLLAKNPAGWASLLPMLGDDDVLIVSINADEVDGLDTSWLWDVPFEELAGRTVGAHGVHRADVAYRLEVAGARPVVDADVHQLARRMKEGPLVIAATYGSFEALRGRR
ncbi:MAG: MurT ligase domain-containing protein [Actinobacteria bacterium]|nr:MurT ligase domain-containing protein [Actinomycetota bacterium]